MLWLWLLLPLAQTAFAHQSTNDSDSSLLWGTYRPNLYFGLRPRVPQSLMTGLMWFGTQDYRSVSRASSQLMLLLCLTGSLAQILGMLVIRVMV